VSPPSLVANVCLRQLMCLSRYPNTRVCSRVLWGKDVSVEVDMPVTLQVTDIVVTADEYFGINCMICILENRKEP